MPIGEFDLRGVNHLALVCRDMAETITFYEDVLGMPLHKTLDLPRGGQHFFFNAGHDNYVAFFWFPGVLEKEPGRTAPAKLPGAGDFRSSIGSMNHIAFTIPDERFDEYLDRLRSKGLEVTVMNHDDSEEQVTTEMHPGVWLRSMYFWDPNGVLLEFACLLRAFTDADVSHDPKNVHGERVPLAQCRGRAEVTT